MSFKITLNSSGNEGGNRLADLSNQCVDESCIVVSVLTKPIGDRVFYGNDRHKFVALTFHIRMRDIKGQNYSFYAVLDLAAMQGLGNSVLILLPKPSYRDMDSGDGVHNSEQQLVFVPIIDISNNGQGMHWKLCSGIIVRLHRFDSREEFIANCIEVPALVGVGRSVPDRKRELVNLRRDSRREFALQQCPKRVIESAAKVMEDICDDQRPADYRRITGALHDDAYAGELRIDVDIETTRFSVKPSKNFTVKFTEQFNGAVYLPIGA